MTNTITKSTAFDLTVAHLGFPGAPPLPQRNWWAASQLARFILKGSQVRYDWIQPQPPSAGAAYPDAQYTPNVVRKTGLTPGQTVPTINWLTLIPDRPVITIAQPAVAPFGRVANIAAQTNFDFNLGWNAGARSARSMTADCSISFNVLQSVGIVAGLNQTDSNGAYYNIGYGFLFIAGAAWVVEGGFKRLSYGAYLRTDVWTVKRIGTSVYYYKNGVISTLGTLAQTPCKGTVFFDTSLYAGGDAVDNPTAVDLYGASATMRPLASLSAYPIASGYKFANTRMQPMTTLCGTKNRAAAVSAYIRAQSSAGFPAFGQVKASAATMRGVALMHNNLDFNAPGPVTYALVGTNTPQFSVGATCLTGQIGGTGVLGVPMMTMRTFGGNAPKCNVIAAAAPATAFSTALDGPLVARMGSDVWADDTMTAPSFLVVVMTSSGLFTSTMTYAINLPAAMTSLLTTTTSMTLQAVLATVMQSILKGSFGTPVANDLNQVWVINSETLAISSYEAFPFNSFFRIGGKYYGTKPDGIYLLEGDTDQGAAIHASANLGRLNFDDLAMKGLPNMYVGVSSTGLMLLKVTTPQGEFIYSARGFDANMKTQRIDVGKGLRANYYQLEMFNQNGADFSLDDVEFRIVKSTTRKVS